MRRAVRVRLHLTDGLPSIEGLLTSVRGDWVELIDVAVLESAHDKHVLDSAKTRVPRERVAFYEELR